MRKYGAAICNSIQVISSISFGLDIYVSPPIISPRKLKENCMMISFLEKASLIEQIPFTFICNPVSSFTSRITASSNVSPNLTAPPGNV